MYRVQHPTKALRQSAKAVHYIITHGSKARKLVRFEKGRHHNLVQADENVMVQWIDASEHCLQTSLYLRGQLHTWIPIHGPLCAYTFHLSICAFILGVRGIKLTTVFFPRSAAAHNDPAAFLVDLTSATFNVVCARGQLRTVADAHLLSAIAASYLSASTDVWVEAADPKVARSAVSMDPVVDACSHGGLGAALDRKGR
jgi:hypothetical protein